MSIFEGSSEVANVIFFIVMGVWIPLFVYFFFNRLARRRVEKLEEYRYERDRRYKYMSHNDTGFERYIPKLLEEIPYITSKEVSREVSKQINKIIKDGLQKQSLQLANKIDSFQTNDNSHFTSNKQLIQEIAHSLNTPLSRIEALAEILATSFELDNKNSKTINSIKSSVDLCKAFILAYRQMILVTGYSGGWEPKSIKESILSACEIYSESVKANLEIKVEAPDQIKGYSNNYIVALLLPLIENAAEAAKPETELDIEFHQENRHTIIRITNTTETLPSGKEIFDAEFSTKKEHQGFGLSIAKSLLESTEGASIDYVINGDKITFELKLRGTK